MTKSWLLDDEKRPRYQLIFYAVAKDGSYGGAALYPGSRFAVADARGACLEDCTALFP